MSTVALPCVSTGKDLCTCMGGNGAGCVNSGGNVGCFREGAGHTGHLEVGVSLRK